MARSWKEAQRQELAFWRRIYVENRPDIATYRPVTSDAAIAFTEKTLIRFGDSLESLHALTVADVGCGPYGLIKGFQVFSERSGLAPAMIYGIDPLMEDYRRFGIIADDANIRLLGAMGERIPLEPGSCDRVYSVNSLDHVENPPAVVAECWRLVKPGGALNVSLHVVRPPLSIMRRWLKYVDTNHPFHFSKGDVRRMLAHVCGGIACERSVPVLIDQPEYALSEFFKDPGLRALRRWAATFTLEIYYARCVKGDVCA